MMYKCEKCGNTQSFNSRELKRLKKSKRSHSMIYIDVPKCSRCGENMYKIQERKI